MAAKTPRNVCVINKIANYSIQLTVKKFVLNQDKISLSKLELQTELTKCLDFVSAIHYVSVTKIHVKTF